MNPLILAPFTLYEETATPPATPKELQLVDEWTLEARGSWGRVYPLSFNQGTGEVTLGAYTEDPKAMRELGALPFTLKAKDCSPHESLFSFPYTRDNLSQIDQVLRLNRSKTKRGCKLPLGS